MRLFNKLFGGKGKEFGWNEIKLTEDVYPQSSFSVLVLRTKTDKLSTGWVDKAYKAYEYKKFCSYNIMINVKFDDLTGKERDGIDMGTIETYFIDELRNFCTAHLVARIVIDNGMNLEIYVDDAPTAKKKLEELAKDSKHLIPFNYQMNYDPKWTAVSELMNPK